MSHSDAWFANQLAHCVEAEALLETTPTPEQVDAARRHLDAHARQDRAQPALPLGVAA